MKYTYVLLIIGALFTACKEIPPAVNPQGIELCDLQIDVENQQRNVLIEEFTGVRCVNCPPGATQIDNLIEEHGERVVAVAIHAGEFSPPYPESKYDFRNPDSDALNSFLGVQFNPAAAFNRSVKSGNNIPTGNIDSWPGFVNSELDKPLRVKISLASSFTPIEGDSANVEICATIFPIDDFDNENIKLTVVLTENNLIDYQLTPTQGKVSDYVHKHALRRAITSFDGISIAGNLMTAGNEISRAFSFDFSTTEWIPENCELVAFISKNNADDKEVVQVVSVHLVE